ASAWTNATPANRRSSTRCASATAEPRWRSSRGWCSSSSSRGPPMSSARTGPTGTPARRRSRGTGSAAGTGGTSRRTWTSGGGGAGGSGGGARDGGGGGGGGRRVRARHGLTGRCPDVPELEPAVRGAPDGTRLLFLLTPRPEPVEVEAPAGGVDLLTGAEVTC